MCSIARKLHVPEADIEELISDLIARIILEDELLKLDDIHSIKNWVFTVTRNACNSFHRRKKPQNDDMIELEEAFLPYEFEAATEIFTGDESKSFSIEKEIPNPRDRGVLRLSYGFEPTEEEWDAIADGDIETKDRIKTDCERLIQDASQGQSRMEEEITSAYTGYIMYEKKERAVMRRLADLSKDSSIEALEIGKLEEKLRKIRSQKNSAYIRYREKTMKKGFRIKAGELAGVIGLEENTIHKIISRARFKLKDFVQ